MNTGSEDFEQLRRLLMLKRHEQPPPGFFDGFSRRVMMRIEAGETGDARVGLWFWKFPWLERWLEAFEQKPALAGAFSLGVCGLLVAGILCSVAPAESPGPAFAGAQSRSLAAFTVPQPAAVSPAFVSSTNGLWPDPGQGSLLEQFGGASSQARIVRVSQ